ncbi:MAG TPA: biotin/lipoyl-containing protein [Candidatus Binataceae bacterium]
MRRIIHIDGKVIEPPAAPLAAEIVECELGVYSLIAAGKSWEVRVTDMEVTIGGTRFTFEVKDPRKWQRSGHASDAHGTITAAMPGKIVRLLAAVGNEVTAGQGIMVIEAMKMQNELKAPRAGRVTAILVKENDSVIAGATLATIE